MRWRSRKGSQGDLHAPWTLWYRPWNSSRTPPASVCQAQILLMLCFPDLISFCSIVCIMAPLVKLSWLTDCLLAPVSSVPPHLIFINWIVKCGWQCSPGLIPNPVSFHYECSLSASILYCDIQFPIILYPGQKDSAVFESWISVKTIRLLLPRKWFLTFNLGSQSQENKISSIISYEMTTTLQDSEEDVLSVRPK